jgi:hypothetical protein
MDFVEALIGAVTIKSIDRSQAAAGPNGILSPAPGTGGGNKEEANVTYGLNPRLFLENGPAIQAAAAHARSSSDAYRAWAGLDAEHRLELVELALRPAANDSTHLPIAL